MNLLVVRHAIAENAADYARLHTDDAGRPLTLEGRKKMKQAAQGLCALMPRLDLLASSPLTRAVQTAEIVGAAYRIESVVVPVLAPGQLVADLAGWLERQRQHETVAIVGHEPGLSRALSWFLAGGDRSFIELKKGAACLLEFADEVRAGAATLLWAATPSQLRALKD